MDNFALRRKIRDEVFQELSDKQEMFCVCGRLATGLHEWGCAKFNRKVDKETDRRMKEHDKLC